MQEIAPVLEAVWTLQDLEHDWILQKALTIFERSSHAQPDDKLLKAHTQT